MDTSINKLYPRSTGRKEKRRACRACRSIEIDPTCDVCRRRRK